MIDARHRWVFPEPLRLDPEVRAAARELGLGMFATTVLARRGIADAEAIARFLGAPEDGLNDPRLLPDADLVDRIRRAVGSRERVMVFGDFDADGLTGLAQL
jgi:single-stranded-DNA-specific exonuclease